MVEMSKHSCYNYAMKLTTYEYSGCKIFHFEFKFSLGLVLAMGRAEEFITHNTHAGKNLNIGEYFDKIYNVDNVDNQFYGCCIIGTDYKKWCEQSELILQEHRVYVKVWKHLDNCFIVGTIEGDDETFNHELAHIFYNKNSNYRETMSKFVDSAPQIWHDHTNDYLKSMEYPTRDYADEKHAFWSTSNADELSSEFNINYLHVSDMRKTFRTEKKQIVKVE